MEQLKGSWKKHVDVRYLSGEDFDKVITLTIKAVVKEETFDPNSKQKSIVTVLHFEETDKGVILNITNGKAIQKITGTRDVEKWVGAKIPFYGKPDKRFGQVVRVKVDYSNVKAYGNG